MTPLRQFRSEPVESWAPDWKTKEGQATANAGAKAARLPPESGGRRRRERRLQRQAGQNRQPEAGATKAKAARLPFGSAQSRKAATKATPERRMPR